MDPLDAACIRLHGDDFPQKTFPRGITADQAYQDSAFSSRISAIVVYLYEVTRRTVEGHRDVEVRSAFLIDWGRLVSHTCLTSAKISHLTAKAEYDAAVGSRRIARWGQTRHLGYVTCSRVPGNTRTPGPSER
jgi:hypothetical protein